MGGGRMSCRPFYASFLESILELIDRTQKLVGAEFRSITTNVDQILGKIPITDFFLLRCWCFYL